MPDHLPTRGHVRALLASGKARQAVDAAKELYKKSPSPESEGLLLDAYEARIQALFTAGLGTEAVSLSRLVAERHRSAAARFDGPRVRWEIDHGTLDSFAALATPDPPPELRDTLLALVRTRVWPADLAACTALPADHPLRQQAAAVASAFNSVTAGPVDEAGIRLAELPRRSPLAPWKPLIWAIAAMHRREDEACERHLAGVDADSAAARLIPAVRAIVAGAAPEGASPALRDLVRAVAADNMAAAREALRKAGAAIAACAEAKGKDSKKVHEEAAALAAAAFAAIKPWPAATRMAIDQVASRMLMANVEARIVASAVPTRGSADYFRVTALACEHAKRHPYVICHAWGEYVDHALDERLIKPGSPVIAALNLHMAGFVALYTREDLAGFEDQFGNQFGDRRYDDSELPWFIDPRALYARAATLDPDLETFRAWIRWEKREDDRRAMDRAATQWHEARPGDVEPLLLLAESAEERDALQKGLKYLSMAEQADPLHPEVKRARARLWMRAAIRNLKQRKPKLAVKHIEALRDSEFAKPGDRRATAVTLDIVREGMQGNTTAANDAIVEVEGILGPAARCFIALMSVECGVKPPADPIPPGSGGASVLGRCCVLCDDFGILPAITAEMALAVDKELAAGNVRIDAATLLSLGRHLNRETFVKVAYAVSTVGLGMTGFSAKFLLMRANSMFDSSPERAIQIIAAVTQLARSARDHALVEEAINLRRTIPSWLVPGADDESVTLSPEHLEAVIEGERAAVRFNSPIPAYVRKFGAECNCAVCRRARAGGLPAVPDPFGPIDSDEEDFDDDFDFDEEDDEDADAEGLYQDFLRSGGDPVPRSNEELLEMVEKLGPDEMARRLREFAKSMGIDLPSLPGMSGPRGGSGAGRRRGRSRGPGRRKRR